MTTIRESLEPSDSDGSFLFSLSFENSDHLLLEFYLYCSIYSDQIFWSMIHIYGFSHFNECFAGKTK